MKTAMKTALIPFCCLFLMFPGMALAESRAELRKDFADPPLKWASRPLWFWNGKLDMEKTRAMVTACKEAGYYGMGILPAQNMGVDFMSEAFLDHYEVAVDQAAELGMKMCLYDEFWFPSGMAGGLLAKKHPEALSRRLDMMEVDVEGPKEVTADVPDGTFMGAVAMHTATFERKNITGQVKDGKLVWQAPPGEWKVMLFTCVRDGGRGLVNFLDPEAVKRFIDLTYQAYHDKFPHHFGNTIDSAFYDEPGMYHVQGGRAWIDSFNERFMEHFGYDPVVHYPAMFFETIGPDTAAARNALFGMRAQLYATGFPKTINDWCRKHGIELTGHVDQEELVNPVIGQAGDLIKAFKYQDMPGIDQVFQYGRASKAYKVVSSSAYNYGKFRIATECYGGIDLPIPNLYKEAMDQFAKGINLMMPHAVWYDETNIRYKPNLTPGDARYGPVLNEYNRYIGRLHRLLHDGKQVADIGVLYPIATLQAGSWFGPGNPYHGCVVVPEADYMDVGEMLSTKIRRDFNFVHPEVLDETCTLNGPEIHLQTASHDGRYQVFIMPGSRAIHWSNLEKIKAFHDQGGTVIATTQLPSFSAEFGKDKEVRETIEAMFGVSMVPHSAPVVSASSSWAAGGFDPTSATDGNPQTRWNAADGAKDEQWLEVDFGEEKTFQKTVVREAFNRTKQYRIQAWVDGKWIDCATGDSLGEEKTDTFDPVTASKARLLIGALDADSVSISDFKILDDKGRNLAGIHQGGPASVSTNPNGGRAYFIPQPDAPSLKAALDESMAVPNVAFENDVATVNGNLSYIHKIVDGRSVYFIGNSSDEPVDTFIRLRGKLDLEWWDPHTGETRACVVEAVSTDDQPVTRVKLQLDPIRSVFLMRK
jgi:hypothetical protein